MNGRGGALFMEFQSIQKPISPSMSTFSTRRTIIRACSKICFCHQSPKRPQSDVHQSDAHFHSLFREAGALNDMVAEQRDLRLYLSATEIWQICSTLLIKLPPCGNTVRSDDMPGLQHFQRVALYPNHPTISPSSSQLAIILLLQIDRPLSHTLFLHLIIIPFI